MKIEELKSAIGTVIVGRQDAVELLLAAVIAGGHVLLEDLPGTGKTLLAKTLARVMGLEFGRVQFTPDLMPSDVTGINYYNQKAGEFIYRKGPVFANILLADEINRATPRTQSSLLEAMEERQVTVDGETRKLPEPFFVIATQNSVESAGTFPLPEAQMDRFLMKLSLGLPGKEEEKQILERFERMEENPYDKLRSVCSRQELMDLQREGEAVYIHPQLLDYLV
ncbi:MAG: AAA family ATPase, partial [Lachnospiraceae bacterium]|nr:AAA family ATPase [Lachnospiraceae bacterium]